jgi:hypothetical protein
MSLGKLEPYNAKYFSKPKTLKTYNTFDENQTKNIIWSRNTDQNPFFYHISESKWWMHFLQKKRLMLNGTLKTLFVLIILFRWFNLKHS